MKNPAPFENQRNGQMRHNGTIRTWLFGHKLRPKCGRTPKILATPNRPIMLSSTLGQKYDDKRIRNTYGGCALVSCHWLAREFLQAVGGAERSGGARKLTRERHGGAESWEGLAKGPGHLAGVSLGDGVNAQRPCRAAILAPLPARINLQLPTS